MKSLALLLAAVASFGCRTTPGSGDGIEFHSLARGYQSGLLPSVGVRIARTSGEWSSLWNGHARTLIPRPETPAVDFTRDMVVFVSIGSKPTYGYAVEVESITAGADGAWRVDACETKPAPDAITSQIVTQPYHMVVTPQRAGEPELRVIPR